MSSHSYANEFGHLANGVGNRILSDTDTIRFIEHTDAASTPIYAHRWHPTTQGRLRTHPLHSWWQPHRPPWQ
jgi:hypothetical protein